MAGRGSEQDDVVRVGAARSEREILKWLIYAAVCPSCGKNGMLVHSLDRSLSGARVGSTCTNCHTLGRYVFTAGPGWDDEPADEDPRLATSEAPSVILAEPVFRRWIDDSLAQLARSPADDRVGISDASQDGLQGVSELRKLRRAAADDLSKEERGAARRFADAFVSTGGMLPSALAWTRDDE